MTVGDDEEVDEDLVVVGFVGHSDGGGGDDDSRSTFL